MNIKRALEHHFVVALILAVSTVGCLADGDRDFGDDAGTGPAGEPYRESLSLDADTSAGMGHEPSEQGWSSFRLGEGLCHVPRPLGFDTDGHAWLADRDDLTLYAPHDGFAELHQLELAWDRIVAGPDEFFVTTDDALVLAPRDGSQARALDPGRDMLTFARVGAYLVGVGGRDDQLWFRSITALAWEPLLHDDAPRYSVGWGRDLRSFGDWAHLTTSEGPDFGSVRSLRIEASDQGITTIEVDSDRGLHDPWASGRDADEVWTLEANELLHSTDRGATFVAAALPSWVSTPTHLMTAGDTLAFIAVTEESVALSLDRGETWDRVSIDVGASTSERWLGGMVDSRRALVLAGACGQVIVRPPHQAISGA